MKIEIFLPDGGENYEEYKIKIDDKDVFVLTMGEPEDACFSRNLGDCFIIPELLKMVYEAGKKGEIVEVTTMNPAKQTEKWGQEK